MSSQREIKRVTVPQLAACKGQRKIVALTAHNYSTARIIDEYVDFVLIGDSTAMVAYGLPDTLTITVEQLGQHTAAVVRATQHACVVADMPFGSYQESPAQAFRNAAHLIGKGASAVKLEGGVVMLGRRTSRYGKKRFSEWLEWLNAASHHAGIRIPAHASVANSE